MRPQIDLGALLTQTHPHIDLKLQAFEDSRNSFLKAVASYKNRNIATISERRNTQAAEKKRIAEKTKGVETETDVCKIKEIELVAELEREKAERKEAEGSVAVFKRQLASLHDRCAALDMEIEQYKALVGNLERERRLEQETLGKYSRVVSPELAQCEALLSCVIEGVDKDKLFFRFTNVDPSDPSREFSFVLDLSSKIYRVPTSSPPHPTLPVLVDNLNATRDIYAFILALRQAYSDLVSRTV